MDRNIRWFNMSIIDQISNIGGEVNRAIKWKNKNDTIKKLNFYNKAIELIVLTVKDPKNKHRIRELEFCKEELKDYFLGDNLYGTTDNVLIKYYDAFLL